MGKIGLQLSYYYKDVWKKFTDKVTSAMDGIKIPLSKGDKYYYLKYRTRNQGVSRFYPYVTSYQNDFAGLKNKPVQLLQIEVYRKDGVKMTSDIVVMYRVLVDKKWLPWVSNANQKCMEAVHKKYKLDGKLETSDSYAGIIGKNISGVEIRVYEENVKLIKAPFISQLNKYPTGCESVTAVMALNHIGIKITVDTFIDKYLKMTKYPFDPNESFGGNPRSNSGYGCYAPVIKDALNKVLSDYKCKNYEAKMLFHVSLKDLCSNYIDKGIPVILWATMEMKKPYESSHWIYRGTLIRWIAPEHCLLLVGYDSGCYIFNDPLKSEAMYPYAKKAVETAYKGLYEKAVVLVKK